MATASPSNQNLAAGAIPTYDTGGQVATNGVFVPVGSLVQTLGYDGSNNLTTITVTYLGHTYVQTFTYTGGNLTGVGQLVQTA